MRIDEALSLAEKVLSGERFGHTLGVRDWAQELAQRHGLSEEKAQLAAVLHDLAKEIPLQHQIRLARRWNLLKYPEDEETPYVLHGPLAAYWLEHYRAFHDREVNGAIAHHTLGYPGMSRLEMLIYSADLTEPNRFFPRVDFLRQALYDNLEKGTLACVEHTLNYLKRNKRKIHPLTFLTYEDLRRRLKFGT